MTDPLHVRLARKAETASNDADAALWREAADDLALMAGLLRRHQWASYNHMQFGGGPACPECRGDAINHKPGCTWAALLVKYVERNPFHAFAEPPDVV